MIKNVCGFARMIPGNVVEKLAQRTFSREGQYIEWLGKSRIVDNEKSTNAFAVFREVCMEKRR